MARPLSSGTIALCVKSLLSRMKGLLFARKMEAGIIKDAGKPMAIAARHTAAMGKGKL